MTKAKHPLHVQGEPFAEIRFIHSDGQEHSFYSYVSNLTDDRLSAFDSGPPTIGHAVAEVRKICQAIHAKAETVLEYAGELAQPV